METGGVELGSSTALPLRAGSHHVTADYSGDAIFARSSTEFLMDVPRRGVAVQLFFGRDLAAFPSTLTARIGLGTEMFEPSGTVTFRDVVSNTVLATAPAASFATVTRDFGANLYSIRAEYSGDDNYLPGMSATYSYSPTTVPVSPHDSRLTVTPTRGGYDIEVQLLGAGGQQIPLNDNNTPSITITSSRGSTGYPLYRDVGRYITSVGARAAVEVLTISARVNNELIGTVTIGPSTPRQRAVHK